MTPIIDTPAPLDPAQHGLWVTEQTLDTESAYHLSLALHIQGPLDPAALTTAWGDYVRATPVLASRTDPAGPVLLPGEAPPLRLVTAAPGDLGKLREEETAARFAPGEALARATLFTTAPDRHLLLVVAHHLVFDGESKDLLVTGVARAYRTVTGETGQLPAAEAPAPVPPVSEADVQDATRFWAGRRHDTQAPALPGLTAHHADPVAPAPGSACGFRRDGEWHARLVSAAATLGVTRFELLTAAWHALLLRYGNTAPAIAIELSTRVPGAPRQVGLHVNELPLFTDPRPELTFADFVQEVRAELRALYAHRTVPLSRAVRGLTPRTALCPVSLSYRRRDASRTADFGPGLDVRTEWTGFARTARNLAHLQLVDAPDSLEGSLQYRTAAFETEAPARVLDHFLTLLEGALAAPDTALGLLPVLPPRERATLLADTTRAPGNAPATLPALFAAQAAATPDAVAVIEGDTTLTYAELDAAE
ncbi:condensation domain-containing protein, partial [Streptomyces sp. SID7909]|uniref:condensation domain-containing protein n=1 Tax=Streptomyces sp. SID7909 TaxID=2706092 RepID=UPI0013B7CFB0